MRIDHFAFEVSDLQASIHFYVEHLGFKVQITFDDPNEHETLVVLEQEGGKLELIQVLDENNQPKAFTPIELRPHFCPHLALQVDDFDQTLEYMRSHGLRIVRGPLEIPGLVKWLYICDPDGNAIEIFQEFAQAPTETGSK